MDKRSNQNRPSQQLPFQFYIWKKKENHFPQFYFHRIKFYPFDFSTLTSEKYGIPPRSGHLAPKSVLLSQKSDHSPPNVKFVIIQQKLW